MSLIDDALKRAQAADEAARGSARPWTPTPMPDPAIARRRALARWLGILAAATAIGGAGVLLVMRLTPGGELRPEKPGEGPVPAAAAAPPATPTPDFVAVATPIVVPPPAGAAPPRAADVSPAPTRRPRPTPAPEGEAVEAAPQEAAVPAAPPPTRPSRQPPGGRTAAGVASLPGGARIELGGIVWSETEPRALLNDRILGVGSYVEGWSVERIEEDRVVLEKDGATLTITVK